MFIEIGRSCHCSTNDAIKSRWKYQSVRRASNSWDHHGTPKNHTRNWKWWFDNSYAKDCLFIHRTVDSSRSSDVHQLGWNLCTSPGRKVRNEKKSPNHQKIKIKTQLFRLFSMLFFIRPWFLPFKLFWVESEKKKFPAVIFIDKSTFTVFDN